MGEEETAAEVVVDPEVVLGRGGRRGGRREWFRVARRELEERREREARPVRRDREDRLFQALGRFEENHRVDLAANEAYDRWRASARDTLGRVLKGNSKPYVPADLPEGTINLSDPDSRVMRTQGTPPRQAYNAQTAVNDRQIILAAEVNVDAPDFGHLEPMLETTLRHLERHGVIDMPDAVLGDAGYWHSRQIESITKRGIEVLIPPDGTMREGKRPGWENGLYELMRQGLHRSGSRALRTTKDHRRTGLRTDQIQPPSRPVHAKRQSRRAVRVAVSGSHPQSPQAPQPLDRQHRLSRQPQVTQCGSAEPPAGPRIPLFPDIPTAVGGRRAGRL